jgi:hypothetical protein
LGLRTEDTFAERIMAAKLECREESFTLLERYEEAMGYKKEADLCLGLPG